MEIIIKDKEVKGYNTLNSGVIFVPSKYVGAKAKVTIYLENGEK